jgi:hypothetical protein
MLFLGYWPELTTSFYNYKLNTVGETNGQQLDQWATLFRRFDFFRPMRPMGNTLKFLVIF